MVRENYSSVVTEEKGVSIMSLTKIEIPGNGSVLFLESGSARGRKEYVDGEPTGRLEKDSAGRELYWTNAAVEFNGQDLGSVRVVCPDEEVLNLGMGEKRFYREGLLRVSAAREFGLSATLFVSEFLADTDLSLFDDDEDAGGVK